MRRWSETVRRTARPSWETPRGTSSLAEMDGGYPCLRGAIWPMCLTTRKRTPANSANPLAAARGREPRLLTSVGAPRKKPPDGSCRQALLRLAEEPCFLVAGSSGDRGFRGRLLAFWSARVCNGGKRCLAARFGRRARARLWARSVVSVERDAALPGLLGLAPPPR